MVKCSLNSSPYARCLEAFEGRANYLECFVVLRNGRLEFQVCMLFGQNMYVNMSSNYLNILYTATSMAAEVMAVYQQQQQQ